MEYAFERTACDAVGKCPKVMHEHEQNSDSFHRDSVVDGQKSIGCGYVISHAVLVSLFYLSFLCFHEEECAKRDKENRSEDAHLDACVERLRAVFHADFGFALRNLDGTEVAECLIDFGFLAVDGRFPVGVVVACDDHEACAVAFDLENLRIHLGACDKLCLALCHAAFTLVLRFFGENNFFAVGKAVLESVNSLGIFHRGGFAVDVSFAHGSRNRHVGCAALRIKDDGADVHQVEERVCCFRIVDVHQVVRVALSATEFTVARKFVVVETVGVAQVVLREDVGAERLIAGEREHARCIDGIGLVWSLDGGNDSVFRLQVFACGDVLDKRAVDSHEFDSCDECKDADLGRRASFPLEDGDAYADDNENQNEAWDDLRSGHAHHHFVQRLEVRGGNGIVQEFLTAHEEYADDGKSNDDGGLDAS